MKIRIGIMGSAEQSGAADSQNKAIALGRSLAGRDLILLTGATTGSIHAAGLAAREAGVMHIGISPGHDASEHVERYGLPLDACEAIIYTGFGLKGRNVVLVRSCEIVLIVGGGMGSLNEFTIAYDEGKIIGSLIGSGGAADEIQRLIETLRKPTHSQVIYDEDADRLLDRCLAAHGKI